MSRVLSRTLTSSVALLLVLLAVPAHAAIRLVGQVAMPATDDATSSVASATFTAPDGIVGNDVCLAFLNVRSTTVTITNTTAGQANSWTANTAVVGATNTYRSFYVKVASGGFTSNPAFGWSVANSYVGWILCFRGVDTSTQIDAAETTATQAAAATFTNASSFISTATNNAVVLHVFTSVDDNTWGTFTAGPAQPYGLAQWRNASTTGSSITISYLTQSSSGGSAAFSANEATLGNDAGVRAAIALRPASVSAESNFAQAGHFSTGTTTSTVAVTTPATPKLVIGLQTRVVGDGTASALAQGVSVMAEGQQRSAYVGAVDNVGFGNSIISLYKLWAANWDPGNPDTDVAAKMKATLPYSSTGFTFTPSVAAAENGRISYLALGGDDITAVAIADFNLPLATGSVAYANIFPFKPDALMFFNSWRSVNAYNELTTVADTDEAVGVQLCFVDASTNQGCTVGAANSQASGATTGSSLSKTAVAYDEYDFTAEFNGGTHQLRYEGAVTSLDSNGFTMNWTTVDATTSGADLRYVVGLKLGTNGKLRVINANTPTSTGNLDITTDTGGTSLSGTTWAGGMFGSGTSGTGGTTRSADELLTAGFWDGTNNECANWWYKEGGGSGGSVPTSDRTYRDSTLAFCQRSANTSATAVGSATVTDLVSHVRFNFTAVNASAQTGVGFVFGPAASVGGGATLILRSLMGVGQ